ncbi:MAG TPA: hypothetical protein VEB88_06180 [Candidatus Acidoferrales bacterium]|nr:hypothetical protein [Candidatus Acidoferrales bacterium]
MNDEQFEKARSVGSSGRPELVVGIIERCADSDALRCAEHSSH